MNQKSCFVIMPFRDGTYGEGHFRKVYEQIIKPSAQECNYSVTRVDEDLTSQSIMEKVFSFLTEADLVICDLSTQNSNVFYELGVRHAYAKPVILIKDDITDFSFDVSGITTIIYNNKRKYEDVIDAREKIIQAIKDTEKSKTTFLNIIKVKKALEDKVNVGDEESEKIALNMILAEIQNVKQQITRIEHKSIIQEECDKQLLKMKNKEGKKDDDYYNAALVIANLQNALKKIKEQSEGIQSVCTVNKLTKEKE